MPPYWRESSLLLLPVPLPQLQILPAAVDPGAHPGVQRVDAQEDPLPLQEVHPALQRLPRHRLQPQAQVPDEPGDPAALPLPRALPGQQPLRGSGHYRGDGQQGHPVEGGRGGSEWSDNWTICERLRPGCVHALISATPPSGAEDVLRLPRGHRHQHQAGQQGGLAGEPHRHAHQAGQQHPGALQWQGSFVRLWSSRVSPLFAAASFNGASVLFERVIEAKWCSHHITQAE